MRLERVEVPEHDFTALVDAAKARTQVMNAHLMCLNTVLIDSQATGLNVARLTPGDVMHFGDQSIGSGGNHDAMVPFGSADSKELYRHGLVPVERLLEACELLDQVLSHTDETIRTLLDLLQLSLDAARAHEYALALTNAWTVCEVVLNLKWRRYLDDRRRVTVAGEEVVFINRDRNDRLTDGSHFTAMVKTETLDLVGAIDHRFYDGLTRARKDRNKWLHELDQPSRDDATRAIAIAGDLFHDAFGIRVALPVHLQVSG